MNNEDKGYPTMEEFKPSSSGEQKDQHPAVEFSPLQPPQPQPYNPAVSSDTAYSGSPYSGQQVNANRPPQGYTGSGGTPNYEPPVRQEEYRQPQGQQLYQMPQNPQMPYNTSPIQQRPPQTQPESPYKFDYNSYESYGQTGKKKGKNGIIVFVVILIISLLLALIAISVASIGSNWLEKAVTDSTTENLGEGKTSDGSGLIDGEDGTGSGEKTEIPQTVKDSKSELIMPPAGSLLTSPQVAAKAIPSVVGIMRYESSYYEATGLGSGFMMLQEGNVVYVTTNAHVVEGGTDFAIRLFDERVYDAKLIGSDSEADLAILSFTLEEGEEVSVAEMGDSDDLLVGETVIAIGTPVSVELSSSVTQGIVSALNRQLQNNNTIGYIQTDAAINPGNSGGALLNLYGQVIGINSLKAAGVDVEGLGFAIPITDALPLITDLIDNGRITIRPVLGIQGRVITEMEAMQLECPVGIMVMEAGTNENFTPELLYEDIITHVNDVEIATLSELKKELEKNGIGDTVTLTVYRKTSPSVSEEVSIKAVLISSDKA